MSFDPRAWPAPAQPRDNHVVRRTLLALGSVVSILVAGVVVYRHWEPAERDASGAIVSAGRVPVTELRVGDCLDETFQFDKRDTYVRGVPCASPHRIEVYGRTTISGSAYPGTTEANNLARAACAAYRLPTDGPPYLRVFIRPDPRTWDDGARWVICMLSAPARTTGAFTR